MRLEEGESKIRIVSSAIVGWEWWDDDEGGRKPKRVKTLNEVPKSVMAQQDTRNRAKHFWAFVVWDYGAKSYKIMEITQKTIMGAIRSLISNEAWGNPQGYDILITRRGKDLVDTEYSVMPNPKSEFKEDTKELANINLGALYLGEDPFSSEAVSPDEVFTGEV